MSCFKQDEAQKNIIKPPPRSSQSKCIPHNYLHFVVSAYLIYSSLPLVDRTIASRMDTSDIVSSTTNEKMMSIQTGDEVIHITQLDMLCSQRLYQLNRFLIEL